MRVGISLLYRQPRNVTVTDTLILLTRCLGIFGLRLKVEECCIDKPAKSEIEKQKHQNPDTKENQIDPIGKSSLQIILMDP